MADVMGDEIDREFEKQLALQTDPNNPTDEFVAIFKELVDREADLAAAERTPTNEHWNQDRGRKEPLRPNARPPGGDEGNHHARRVRNRVRQVRQRGQGAVLVAPRRAR